MTPIPSFEGIPVDASVVKMSGAAPLDDLTDVVLGIDDVVQMVSQFRVIDVRHKVDEKTGNLVRVQILRPIEMALAPINPEDPDDDGIIRALPRPVNGTVTASSDDDEDGEEE